jgi:hypothetical protein
MVPTPSFDNFLTRVISVFRPEFKSEYIQDLLINSYSIASHSSLDAVGNALLKQEGLATGLEHNISGQKSINVKQRPKEQK